MGTQVTKSCALTFIPCACAVFYPFPSPPEPGVHFPALFHQEHLCAGDHCLCNMLAEVSYFPTANGCKCGPLKLWLTPDKAVLPHPRALFRAGIFVLWYLHFVRASWQRQQRWATFVNLFLIKKVSVWPKRVTKLCFFMDTAYLNMWKYFQSVVCSLIISFKHPELCDQGAHTKVAVLVSGNFSLI